MKARWLAAMGIFALLVGTPLGAVTGCGTSGSNPSPSPSAPGPLQFALLEEGVYSQIPQDQEIVIQDQAAWAAFYRQHDPAGTMPAVDFTRQMVVGVVLQRNTGGFLVRLDAVREDEDRVVVAYTETRPNPDAVTIQVLTQPYFLATVSRRDLPVTFEHTVEIAPAP